MRAFLGFLVLFVVAAFLSLDAAASTGTTEWIGYSQSSHPAVTDDGRYVAFTLDRVYLRDRLTGQTEVMDLNSDGQQGNAGSWLEDPAISADGRFVAFRSNATNLVPGDTNAMADIFVRDRLTGLTERINVTNTGSQAGWLTESHVSGMSADGRYVAFYTNANLDPTDGNGTTDAYVRDRLLGTSTRVSMHPDGGPQSMTLAYQPNISADGRFVGFYSFDTLVPATDTNFQPDIYVYDRELGTRALISATTAGVSANGRSEYRPSLSADGRFVSFYSAASDLVANDSNNIGDIFVRDRDTDADGIFDEPEAVSTELVSADSAGVISNGPSLHHSITNDGRFVTFTSEGTNLVPDDTNGKSDIFLRDRTTGETSRISISSSGGQGNDASNFPDISGDGTAIAFQSVASTLVPGKHGAFVHSFTGLGATAAPTLPFTPTPGATPVPTPTPTPIPTPVPTGPLVALALDADSSGNGPTVLGATQPCRSTSVSNVFDVDVVVRAAPPPGISGVWVHLLYDPAVLRVVASDSALMLAASGPMNPIPFRDPLPDTDGNFMVGVIDQSDFTETGDGVLVRMTLEALGNGVSQLDLNDTSGADADGYPDIQGRDSGVVFVYDNIAAADGQIAVGQVCTGTPATPTPTPTPTPTSTATPTPTPSPTPNPLPNDDDGDLVASDDEPPCGGDHLNARLRPERIDGPFAQQDDDGDLTIDESLPLDTGPYDCDGDGYTTEQEAHVFGGQSDRDQDACGLGAWPADFVAGSIPDSTNRITLADLTSFLAPVRRINTSPGDDGYDVRWDLTPGAGLLSKVVNISDLTSILTLAPPMFGGVRSFGSLTCPWPE